MRDLNNPQLSRGELYTIYAVIALVILGLVAYYAPWYNS